MVTVVREKQGRQAGSPWARSKKSAYLIALLSRGMIYRDLPSEAQGVFCPVRQGPRPRFLPCSETGTPWGSCEAKVFSHIKLSPNLLTSLLTINDVNCYILVGFPQFLGHSGTGLSAIDIIVRISPLLWLQTWL